MVPASLCCRRLLGLGRLPRAALLVAVLAILALPGDAIAASPPPSALPPATYPSTYAEQLFIRMDDGVELGATITFPSEDGSAPAPGRFPTPAPDSSTSRRIRTETRHSRKTTSSD